MGFFVLECAFGKEPAKNGSGTIPEKGMVIFMSMINISNLTFCYDGSFDNVFENVSFRIDTDWKLGFTGRNGRGKTTFLKLLTGEYDYRGSITASVGFEYFPYDVEDKTRNTIDILYDICSDLALWQLERELSKLSVPDEVLYRPFLTLSSGEQTKTLLAAMFLKENNFLLIDEPTNHLDLEARAITAAYLNSKKGFILVSHDRAFLDACVDHILSINKTNIEIQSGNFSFWYYNKQLQDSYETEQNALLKKDIKRLTETAREKADWSDKLEATKIGTHQGDRGRVGHLAAKMMKRSKAIEQRSERAIDEKSKLLRNIEEAEDLKIHPLSYHAKRLAEAERIAIFYGDKQVCEDISFVIEQGDRVALRGKNGSGKSSVVKLLCGENITYTGGFFRASGLKVSYVPQEAGALSGSLAEYEEYCGIDKTLFRAILRKLDFARVQFEKDLSDYSAGQKKKVLLARSLCEQAHLYVWDEPLNYIDVLSRIQIESLLEKYKPTLLFVEHDKAFCDNIATKIIEL